MDSSKLEEQIIVDNQEGSNNQNSDIHSNQKLRNLLLIIFFICIVLTILFIPLLFYLSKNRIQHRQSVVIVPSPTVSQITTGQTSKLNTSSQPANSNSIGTMFAADKERTGMYLGKGIDHTPTPEWTFTTDHTSNPIDDQGESIPSSPVVADGSVFFTTIDGNIYAVNVMTGKKIWKMTTDCTSNYSSPAYAGGKLYIGSDCDGLSAIDTKSGKILWNFNPIKKENNNSIYTDNHFTVNSSPVVIDGKIYAGTQDGIYILDADSGNVILHAIGAKGSTVALSADTMFSNDGLGQLVANDLTSGKIRWSKKITGTTLFSNPVISGGTVLIGNDAGALFALNASTGKDEWTYTPCTDSTDTTCTLSFRGTPATDGSTAYTVWSKGEVSAVDLATGKEKWRLSVGNLPLYSPIINNNTLYVTTLNHEVNPNNNYVYAVDVQTGQKKWEYIIPPRPNRLGNSILNSPALYDGVLYFGTDAGILYALH